MSPPTGPTYANVVASLALYVAPGGTSYAVSKLGAPRSAADVQNGSLRAADISKTHSRRASRAGLQVPRERP